MSRTQIAQVAQVGVSFCSTGDRNRHAAFGVCAWSADVLEIHIDSCSLQRPLTGAFDPTGLRDLGFFGISITPDLGSYACRQFLLAAFPIPNAQMCHGPDIRIYFSNPLENLHRMSITLEEPITSPPVEDQQTSSTASRRLRGETTAARISFHWLGTRKTLSTDQKAQAADTFGAERESLSASKRLLDASHPAFKAVTAVKTRTTNYWKGVSLPYPESGIRLIRQRQVDSFNEQMHEFRQDLEEAAWRLDEHYAELRDAARQQLGNLYDPSDYPTSLRDTFAILWDFPSVEPPDYLRQLSPEIYEAEKQRVSARFDEAVQMAEAAFVDELHTLVTHLSERLSGQNDGKPKVFRDSAVTNLNEFFDRFRQLNVRSNEQLDQLVDQCRDIVGGVAASQLREDSGLRTAVVSDLGQITGVLDELLVDRPRRNILRRPR